MIQNTLSTLAKELDDFVRRRFQINESKVVLSALLDNSGAVQPHLKNKLVVTLAGIDEELMKRSNFQSTGRTAKMNPPIGLGINMLVSAFFDDYDEALKYLSMVNHFFHGKSVFTPQNTPGLNPEISTLTVQVSNLNHLEQQSLWTTQGTHYRPSILFRLRGLYVVESQIIHEVPTIEVQPSLDQ